MNKEDMVYIWYIYKEGIYIKKIWYIYILTHTHTHTHTISSSSVNGHLGCLLILAIVNNATMNIRGTCIFLN